MRLAQIAVAKRNGRDVHHPIEFVNLVRRRDTSVDPSPAFGQKTVAGAHWRRRVTVAGVESNAWAATRFAMKRPLAAAIMYMVRCTKVAHKRLSGRRCGCI